MAEASYWSQIKEAVALTISDTQELAIMRLKDIAGDELFPAIDRAVAYGVDQVELQAEAATKGADKENDLVDLVMPAVRDLLKEKIRGPFVGIARRPLEEVIEGGLRALAKTAVQARNRAFSKRWAATILKGVHWSEAKLEEFLHQDLDKDGGVGTIGGVDY